MPINKIALFDLDHTLIHGDSDWLWGEHLTEKGITDKNFRRENNNFQESYLAGTLDSTAYLKFVLTPMKQQSLEKWQAIRSAYLEQKIAPLITDIVKEFIAWHDRQGYELVIITATNSFITRPIADMFEVPHLIASDIEIKDGIITGNPEGIPCFKEGKVKKLHQWFAGRGIKLNEVNTRFYSDSINDLPLLNTVNKPIATNPCEQLKTIAVQNNWTILNFWLD